jgi:hypothetical protein
MEKEKEKKKPTMPIRAIASREEKEDSVRTDMLHAHTRAHAYNSVSTPILGTTKTKMLCCFLSLILSLALSLARSLSCSRSLSLVLSHSLSLSLFRSVARSLCQVGGYDVAQPTSKGLTGIDGVPLLISSALTAGFVCRLI